MKKQALRTIEYLLSDNYNNSSSNSTIPIASHQFAKLSHANMNPGLSHNMNKLLPLSAFKSNKYHKYSLFPEAKKLPTFFQHNLLNQGRVVKDLEGIEGVLRGFYYQLLKLGFEIQNNTQSYARSDYFQGAQFDNNSNIDYSSVIKNALFDGCLFSPIQPYLEEKYNSAAPASGKKFNITQYSRIIIEFMLNLEAQVIPNVDLTIAEYPIIDQAFLTVISMIIEKNYNYFLGKTGISDNMLVNSNDQKFHPRSAYHTIKNQQQQQQQNSGTMVISTIVKNLLKKISIESLLLKLCSLFNITLEVFENCYSFSQSDVFMYIPTEERQDKNQQNLFASSNNIHVYLAYLSEMAQVQSFTQSQQSSSVMEDIRHSSSLKKKSINSHRQILRYNDQQGDDSEEYNKDMQSSGLSNPNKAYQSSRYSSSVKDSFRLSAGNVGRGRIRDIPYKSKKNNNSNSMSGQSENIVDSLTYSQSQKIQQRNNSKYFPELNKNDKEYHIKQNLSNSNSLSLESLNPVQNSVYQQHPHKNVFSNEQYYPQIDQKKQKNNKHRQIISQLDKQYEESSENNNNLASQEIGIGLISTQKKSKNQQYDEIQGRQEEEPISPLLNAKGIKNIYTNQYSNNKGIIQSNSVQSISERGSHSATTGQQISVMEYKGRLLPTTDRQYHSRQTEPKYHRNDNIYEEIQNIKNKQSYRKLQSQGRNMDKEYYNRPLNPKLQSVPSSISISSHGTIKNNLNPRKSYEEDSSTLPIDSKGFSRFKKEDHQIHKKDEQTDIFYKPNVKKDVQKQIQNLKSQNPMMKKDKNLSSNNIYTSNKIQHLQRQTKIYEKNTKDQKQDSLGTFYRQFSDTKVMEAMVQPFKSHVSNTRKRFKGIHKKNYMVKS